MGKVAKKVEQLVARARLEEGCVKITLIASCLEWLTCLPLFIMV